MSNLVQRVEVRSKMPIRAWIDGCFDLVHFGHANVIRQAKCLSDYLIVGIHSDEEIMKHKGPPVFNQDERYTLLKSIKWVDEVVKDAPYCTELKTLNEYNCDFVVHGDDISLMDNGLDAYAFVKEAGKYREVKRTEGISTTNLVIRMLQAIQNSNKKSDEDAVLANGWESIGIKKSEVQSLVLEETVIEQSSPYTSGGMSYIENALRLSDFLASNGQSTANLEGIRPVNPGETVVYICGVFDLFHVGHVEILKKCRLLGSYVIVGLYSDNTAKRKCASFGPILKMSERLLSILSCRYVNNVIIDAPYVLTDNIVDFFKIDLVVVGTISEDDEYDNHMAVAKQRGIYHRIDSGSNVTTAQVIQRIMQNQLAYKKRNRVKECKETALDQVLSPVTR